MSKYKITTKLFVCLSLILCQLNPAQSSLAIDLTLKGEEENRHVRVVAVDTEKQRLLHYETIPVAAFQRPLREFMQAFVQPPVLDKEMNYIIAMNAEGIFSIHANDDLPHNVVSLRKYIFTCKNPIYSGEEVISVLNPHLKRNVYTPYALDLKTPFGLTQCIKGLPNKKSGLGGFSITLHAHPNMDTLPALGTAEKGVLGEWFTKITMFSFGYNRLPSKYGGNHGLDGVFLSADNAHLVFSQSKLGDSNPMANTLIEKELDEKGIDGRMTLMAAQGSEAVKATRLIMLNKIENDPDNIWKMGHCTFDCGLADLRLKKFKLSNFPIAGKRLFNTPVPKKVEAVQVALNAYADTPMQKLELALASININDSPKKQVLRKVMETQGLAADIIDLSLAAIPDDEE